MTYQVKEFKELTKLHTGEVTPYLVLLAPDGTERAIKLSLLPHNI